MFSKKVLQVSKRENKVQLHIWPISEYLLNIILKPSLNLLLFLHPNVQKYNLKDGISFCSFLERLLCLQSILFHFQPLPMSHTIYSM